MLLDPTRLKEGEVVRSDICVIGSGPAGLTIARSLADRGASVLLAEAGAWEWESESQDLYAGDWVGDDPYPLDAGRLRQFGGTSGHWEGFCRPLDTHDFLEHAGYPTTGWPIRSEALAPYLEAADEILEVPTAFESRDLGGGLERMVFQQSPPVRFGEKYRDYVETAETLRFAVRSAAVDMTPDDRGGVRSVTFQSHGGPSWKAEARYFVLCAGGIENSRLLKWFNARNDHRLVANHDLIGRYWMEHPYPTVGEALLWSDDPEIFDAGGRGFFELNGALQQELKVLSGAFGIFPNPYGRSWIKNMVGELMCVAPGLGRRLMKIRNRELVCGARVLLQAEQVPQAENRVDLGNETDALGIPRLVMHWRRTELDQKSIATSTLAFGELLAAADIGRLKVPEWITDPSQPMPDGGVLGAYHHMGGTRMSATPETGIVNADCRVHDLDNLYIGGSSVFPTGGCSNPTLPIVQFALRLGEHLGDRLRAL